jgi:hypothetical protein
MKVVIVGGHSRDELKDKPLVDKIVDDVQERYPKLMIVTKSGDKGIGKIIYERNKASQAANRQPEFDMMEFNVRHMLRHELPKHEFLSHFNLLNAALLEVGDEFHILTDNQPVGSTKDILERVKAAGIPYVVYTSSDPIEAKRPIVKENA